MTEIRQRSFMPPSRSEIAADHRRSVIRAVTGVAFSSVGRSAEQYVAAAWPDDRVAQMIARTATAPMTISSSGLPAIVAINILAAIGPMSAAQRLFARCLRVNLDHITQVFVPRGLPVVTPIFIGEGKPLRLCHNWA
jgi:hypothetical protein